jgi:SEC-C motif
MGRNDPCACGSGKRFKSCCGRLTDRSQLERTRADPGAPGGVARQELVAWQESEELAALLNAGVTLPRLL